MTAYNGGMIMAEMNVDYINPFLKAAISIIKDACQVELKVGKPYASSINLTDDTVIILIGVTGEMRGQVVLSMHVDKACDIASRMMMGMPVEQLDDMATSAISELGNMIMGNAATIFSTKNIGIDITPPTVGRGSGKIDTLYSKNIVIPLLQDNDEVFIEMNIAMKIG